jgi:hypothetical protein
VWTGEFWAFITVGGTGSEPVTKAKEEMAVQGVADPRSLLILFV